MSYTPYYNSGGAGAWQDGSDGGTPINAAALNNLENGVVSAAALADELEVQADTLDAQKANYHYIGDATTFSKGFRIVNTAGNEYSKVHARARWGWENTTERANFNDVPTALASTATAFGIREVIYFSQTHIMVRVTELYPTPGRIHTTCYNSGNGWTAWKTLSPA